MVSGRGRFRLAAHSQRTIRTGARYSSSRATPTESRDTALK